MLGHRIDKDKRASTLHDKKLSKIPDSWLTVHDMQVYIRVNLSDKLFPESLSNDRDAE